VLAYFAGKTFLNSIEYLDEKTNEWTTFVPKLEAEDSAGAFQPEMMQENGIVLGSVDMQPEQENGIDCCKSVDAHENGNISYENTDPIEGIVSLQRRRNQSNSRDACQQNASDGGCESLKRLETSS
jgi:hypothetical protein